MKLGFPCRFGRVPMLVCVVLFMPAGNALTQTEGAESQDAGGRCSGPEYRKFDFWLGNWEVLSARGALLGHNEIRRVAGGCGLLESWQGIEGSRGVSINTYDTDLEKWTQRWVGAGANLWLEGNLEGGRMVLAGTAPRSTENGAVLDRVTWTPLPDGRVRQVWEVSADGGSSWRPLFEGFYSAVREHAATTVEPAE